ncbi:hypothetical protein KY284_037490 [Solanum tuberosum]|nr:hypothetical protein KY284_037490 [Solanum tuberosum]
MINDVSVSNTISHTLHVLLLSDSSSDSGAGTSAGRGTNADASALGANYEPVAPAYALVTPLAHAPAPAPESLELLESLRTFYVCEIMFDKLTSLIIHMQSHPEVNSYVLDWDGDSD